MEVIDGMIDNALGTMANDMQNAPTRSQLLVNMLRGGQPMPAASAAGAPPVGQPAGGASGSWGAPEPQAGNASASWGPPQPRPAYNPQNPLAQATAAARAQRPQVQTPPPMQPPQMTPPTQNPPFDPLIAQGQALDAQEKAITGQMQKLTEPPDRTQAQAVYDKRVQSGDNAMLLALAAQQAGPGFEPFQQFAMKQAAEAKAPMKVAGGEFTPQGFIEDANYVADKRLALLNTQLSHIQAARNSNITEQSRQTLKREEDKIRQEMQQLTLGLQATIAQQASADRNLATNLRHEDRQDALAAKGAAGKGTVDPQHLIDLVGEARQYLPKATSSGLGRRVDQTAAFFGESTPGAQASAALDTVGGQLVMAQPRMEGPQSDKDVLLYRQMAGDVANRDLPIATRAAALDAIEKVAQKYRSGEFVPPGPQRGGNQPRVAAPPTSPGLPAGWSVQTRP
jgi:hypothetical protein